MQVRALVGARVSVYDDPSQTSPYTQLAAGGRYAELQGWHVIATFEDLDVSATVPPRERPDLGPWINDKSDEWDAIIWSKVDRAFRSIFDCAEMAKWAEQNRKILVFTEDGITLNFRDGNAADFATMMAKAFLIIASLFAEMEHKRITGRFLDAHAYLRTTTRWSGGLPPFGYTLIDHPEGEGRALAIDPVSSEWVRQMAGWVIAGKSLYEVAVMLNENAIPTAYEYGKKREGSKYRGKGGKVAEKNAWNGVKVAQILRNPAMLGVRTTGSGRNVKILPGNDGLPIQMADPIFTEDEWLALQTQLDARTTNPVRTKGAGPLLGVAYCGGCGSRLYKMTNRQPKYGTYVYAVCNRTDGVAKCKGYSFREDYLLEILDDQAPQKLAERQRMRKVFVPGEDHTRQLAQIDKAMANLREERDMGAYDYSGGDDAYKTRLMSLVEKRKLLEGLPQRPDEWRYEPTGETYADAYLAADREGRRLLCIDAGIKLVCNPGPFIEVHVPPVGSLDESLAGREMLTVVA